LCCKVFVNHCCVCKQENSGRGWLVVAPKIPRSPLHTTPHILHTPTNTLQSPRKITPPYNPTTLHSTNLSATTHYRYTIHAAKTLCGAIAFIMKILRGAIEFAIMKLDCSESTVERKSAEPSRQIATLGDCTTIKGHDFHRQNIKSSDCVICCQVTLQRNAHFRFESQKLSSCWAHKPLQRFKRKWRRWGPFPPREINPKRNFINGNRYYSDHFAKPHYAYDVILYILGSHGIPQDFSTESKVSSKSILEVDRELS